MKRGIFFWLERLKVAPAERKTIAVLLVILGMFGGLNMALSPTVPFEDGDYDELETQFAERTALLKMEEQKLLEQYHPPAEQQLAEGKVDTVEEDSTSSEGKSKDDEKDDQKQENDKINVNTASAEALESLPGIGPTYSKRIVKYRQDHGKIKSVAELKKIKGIAEKRLDKLKPFVKLKDSN